MEATALVSWDIVEAVNISYLANNFGCLGIPAEGPVIFARRQQKIGVLLTPRQG